MRRYSNRSRNVSEYRVIQITNSTQDVTTYQIEEFRKGGWFSKDRWVRVTYQTYWQDKKPLTFDTESQARKWITNQADDIIEEKIL